MKIVKKVIFSLITLILVIVLLFNLYNFISLKILKKDLPTIGGYAILEVATGSMEPTLKIGDLIIINTKEKNYQENDIITFYDVNNSFVTHRLVSLNDDTMITKGDANNTVDESLPSKNIVGKYLFKIGGLGLILKSLRSPFVSGMILIIGILICYFLSLDKDGNLIIEEEDFNEFIENKEEPKESFIKKITNKLPKKAKNTKAKAQKKAKKKAKIKNKKKRKTSKKTKSKNKKKK